MTTKTGTPFKKTLTNIITVVCIIVFAYSLFHLVKIGYMYYQNHQVLSEVQDVYGDLESEPPSSIEFGERKIRSQFEELQQINEDIVGWISIDDTKIDYPILQAPDNDYYLSRNYEHSETAAGSIFMDYRNDVKEYEPNVVVYGHRMKDNSMFNSLKDFLDEDFFYDHGTIQYDTMYDSYDAVVFSAYSTTTDFNYIETDFEGPLEYFTLLSKMQAESKFDTEMEFDIDDQIITLSTCDYMLDPNEGRLVVHAKLIKRDS